VNEGDAALHEQHAQCLMELEQYEAAAQAARRAAALQPTVSASRVCDEPALACDRQTLTASALPALAALPCSGRRLG
jgi:hypothetical protein